MKKLKGYSHFDLILKKKFKRRELKRLLGVSILKNANISLWIKLLVQANTVFKSTRIRNRCLVNGSGSAVISSIRLSRIPIRHLISYGRLSGFQKANV